MSPPTPLQLPPKDKLPPVSLLLQTVAFSPAISPSFSFAGSHLPPFTLRLFHLPTLNTLPHLDNSSRCPSLCVSLSPHLHPRPPVPGLLSVSLLHTSPTWVGLPAVGSPSSSPSSLRCLTWRSWSLCVQHHIRLVPGGARVGPLAHSLGTRWNTGHDFSLSLALSGTRPCANSSCGFSLNVSPLSLLQAEEMLGVEKALRRCYWLPVLPSTCHPGGLESF